MISFRNVAVSYGTQDVLRDVSFKVNAGERIGIVGPNGAGKSTLLGLISGESAPASGSVVFEGVRPVVGYLHQQLYRWDSSDTVLSYAMKAASRTTELEKRISELESSLSSSGGNVRDDILSEIGRLQTEFEHLGGYGLETEIKAALGGLGFKASDFDRPFSEFSGGWKMRAELVRTIVTHPGLLMLDEPSNYLDLPAVEWMQRFLREYEGTLMLISHDRYLLRTLTNVTLEVDGGTVTRYNGGLDFYMEERVRRYRTLLAAKKNQDRIREQTIRFIETFRYTPTKAAQVQSRVKQLEKMEPVIVPKQASEAGHMRLPEFHHCGTTVLTASDAGFSYDGTHFVFRGTSFDVSRGEHAAVVGFNGLGKTTLLRLFVGSLVPTEGEVTLGHKVVTGYVSQEFSETVPPERSLVNVVKREDPSLTEAAARSLLGSFGFSGDDVFKCAGVLSGGEKIRLAFARLFAQKPNFLVLDEPTTHLDINGRKALEEQLREYAGTVIVVSHDVEFVRNVAQCIIYTDGAVFRKFQGGYDDYRAYCARGDSESRSNRRGSVPDPSPRTDEACAAEERQTLNRKEQRRMRAEEREKRLPLIRSLKRRVEETEKRIAQLESEQNELVASLSSEDVRVDFAATNRRLSDIQKELETLNLLWEQTASDLAFHEAR